MLDTETMATMMREFLDTQCMRIFEAKNKAYAQTHRTQDGLSNFYEEADAIGIDVDQYWRVLWGKHRRALETYIRTGEAPAPIYKIICDLIVYELIFYCLEVDAGRVDHEAVVTDTSN